VRGWLGHRPLGAGYLVVNAGLIDQRRAAFVVHMLEVSEQWVSSNAPLGDMLVGCPTGSILTRCERDQGAWHFTSSIQPASIFATRPAQSDPRCRLYLQPERMSTHKLCVGDAWCKLFFLAQAGQIALSEIRRGAFRDIDL